MDEYLRHQIYRFSLLMFFALLLSPSLREIHAQDNYEATYHNIRFVGTSGDSLYFGQIVEAELWRDRWVLFLDGFDNKVYLANTHNLNAVRIGEDGDGPGEYRNLFSFYTRGDTLIVHHDGMNKSLFLLPSGEFLSRTHINISPMYFYDQLWISRSQYLSQCRPRVQRKEWLFGRFNTDAELLQPYGEWDFVERFDGSTSLQGSMNSGYLGMMPNGNIAFLYVCQPKMLVFTVDGELKQEYALDMPWNDKNAENPAYSRQYGYATRGYIFSMQVIEDGFLVACRGFKRRDGIMKNIGFVPSLREIADKRYQMR